MTEGESGRVNSEQAVGAKPSMVPSSISRFVLAAGNLQTESFGGQSILYVSGRAFGGG